MKRRILLLIACLVSISSFAQIEIDSANFAPHKDYYIMPLSFGSERQPGCAPFVPYERWVVTDSVNCGICGEMIVSDYEFEYAPQVGGIVSQIVQPFYTDTALTIQGLAFQHRFRKHRSCAYPDDIPFGNYYGILDSNLNVVIWDTVLNGSIPNFSTRYIPNYREHMFENPVTVRGRYFVLYKGEAVLGILDSCANNYPLGFYNTYGEPPTNFVSFNDFQTSMNTSDTNYYLSDLRALDVYAFPIYLPTPPPQDTTTTNDTIITNDTITNDTSSLITINNIETNLFPNPAKDVLNITSTQSMERVQVFNLLGQMIKEEEIDGNFTERDIKGLKAGSYIAKVLFGSGVITRKFVVE